MLATRYKTLQTERPAAAGSEALGVSLKEVAPMQQCCQVCQKPGRTPRVSRSFECTQMSLPDNCTYRGRRVHKAIACGDGTGKGYQSRCQEKERHLVQLREDA